jgi:hypothetical protein
MLPGLAAAKIEVLLQPSSNQSLVWTVAKRVEANQDAGFNYELFLHSLAHSQGSEPQEKCILLSPAAPDSLVPML